MNPPFYLESSPGWRLQQARDTDRRLRLRDLRRRLRRTHFLMRWVPRDTWVAITCGPIWVAAIFLAVLLKASAVPGVTGFLVTYGCLILLEKLHKELQLQECRVQSRITEELALESRSSECA